jgi:hypothetical protein
VPASEISALRNHPRLERSRPGALFLVVVPVIGLLLSAPLAYPQSQAPRSAVLGFDRNDYPGDDQLAPLRQRFAYSGYWLNNPPQEKQNQWRGKRQKLEEAGFGFLVLFNGRLYADLKTVARAKALGGSDAKQAGAAARREGFPPRTVIFLDQEQGGRMLPEQKAYIYAWVDGVARAGFRAGIYCSGIPAADDGGVVTADDLNRNAGGRDILYWVTNDVCPPSPGCALPHPAPDPSQSGVPFAAVWQFAQSPERKDFAAQCPRNYSSDLQCYYPAAGDPRRLAVDVNTARSSDPSQARVSQPAAKP